MTAPFWAVGEAEEFGNGQTATVRHVDGVWAVLEHAHGFGFFVGYGDPEVNSPDERAWYRPDDEADFPTMAEALEALAVAQHDPGSGGVNRWRLGEVEGLTGATVVHVDGARAVLRDAGEGGGFFVGYAPPDAREPGRSWCYGDAADGATFATLESAVAALEAENAKDAAP